MGLPADTRQKPARFEPGLIFRHGDGHRLYCSAQQKQYAARCFVQQPFAVTVRFPRIQVVLI